ncbi:uncharacterized protein JCM6883_006816 [Sporobolomyces salmoneus]|uniref:uncharacterized protein n=1 Tax=Sporobolomyces salmoneus TaxID=183962 RepID=UPI003182AD05
MSGYHPDASSTDANRNFLAAAVSTGRFSPHDFDTDRSLAILIGPLDIPIPEQYTHNLVAPPAVLDYRPSQSRSRGSFNPPYPTHEDAIPIGDRGLLHPFSHSHSYQNSGGRPRSASATSSTEGPQTPSDVVSIRSRRQSQDASHRQDESARVGDEDSPFDKPHKKRSFLRFAQLAIYAQTDPNDRWLLESISLAPSILLYNFRKTVDLESAVYVAQRLQVYPDLIIRRAPFSDCDVFDGIFPKVHVTFSSGLRVEVSSVSSQLFQIFACLEHAQQQYPIDHRVVNFLFLQLFFLDVLASCDSLESFCFNWRYTLWKENREAIEESAAFRYLQSLNGDQARRISQEVESWALEKMRTSRQGQTEEILSENAISSRIFGTLEKFFLMLGSLRDEEDSTIWLPWQPLASSTISSQSTSRNEPSREVSRKDGLRRQLTEKLTRATSTRRRQGSSSQANPSASTPPPVISHLDHLGNPIKEDPFTAEPRNEKKRDVFKQIFRRER